MDGIYFTDEELKDLDLVGLRNVASYLKIEFDRRASRSKLIALIQKYQRNLQPNLVSASDSTIPRYSVRVQRIIDSMAKKGQPQ